jgi:hypothetical protein
MIWLVVAVGLLLLILVHELGHFVAALAVGIQPRKFYVGFPPAIVKLRYKGVEYGIGAIPLGGYVKIPGMHRPAARDFETWMRAALHEEPGLTSLAQQVRRQLDAEDCAGARASLPELQRVLELTTLSQGRGARPIGRFGSSRRAPAVMRTGASRRERLVVIAARPFAERPRRLRDLLRCVRHRCSVGETASTKVAAVSRRRRRPQQRTRGGRQDRRRERKASRPLMHSHA